MKFEAENCEHRWQYDRHHFFDFVGIQMDTWSISLSPLLNQECGRVLQNQDDISWIAVMNNGKSGQQNVK